MVDAGAHYGRTIGQIGYVVNIDAALRAGVRIYRTPLGSYTVIQGGIEPRLICAVMVYTQIGNHGL
eukprot:8156567-Heterocapsa_arctica.AAC.1